MFGFSPEAGTGDVEMTLRFVLSKLHFVFSKSLGIVLRLWCVDTEYGTSRGRLAGVAMQRIHVRRRH